MVIIKHKTNGFIKSVGTGSEHGETLPVYVTEESKAFKFKTEYAARSFIIDLDVGWDEIVQHTIVEM